MKQTNNYLCFFQAIASFLVIYIHASVPFKGSFFLMGIARMAVPFYFLISGYFSFSNEEKKMVKDTKMILKKQVLTKTRIINILFCYFSSIAIPILIFMETLSRPDAVAENQNRKTP